MSPPDRLLLDVANRKRLGLDIVEAVVDGELAGGVQLAPALTLTLADPDRRLIESRVLVRNAIRTLGEPEAKTLRPIDLRVGAGVYRLTKALRNEEAGETKLQFVARPVVYLGAHDGPLVASRGKVTRAQFARREVEETGRRPGKARGRIAARAVNFWAPEIGKRQPLAPLSAEDRRQLRGDAEQRRGVGGAARAARSAKGLTVKGLTATVSQRRTAAIALEESAELNAGPKATLALIMALIVEAELGNPTGGHGTSVGPLQLTDDHLGGSTSTDGGRRDLRLVCRLFHRQGFTTRAQAEGGAIGVAKQHPGFRAGQVAQYVQGSRHPERYEEAREEAQRFVEVLGDGDGTGAGADGDAAYVQRYAFRREQGTDAWTHTGELADEVQWRRFLDGQADEGLGVVAGNTVIFAPDRALYGLRARMRLRLDDPAIVRLEEYELGYGKTVREVSLAVAGDEWRVPWGQPIVLENAGPITGKWLVWEITHPLWAPEATVVLRQPSEERPEPRSSVATRSSDDADDGGGSLRDRIVEEAKKSLSSRTGHNWYLAGGPQVASKLKDPTPPRPYRSDCSQWVYAIYLRAGAQSPGLTTVQQIAKGKRTTRPKPGDLLIGPSHVELFVGDGKTIGHGSPPIDYSTVAYWKARGHFFVTFDFLD
jgi:hypothetical protein